MHTFCNQTGSSAIWMRRNRKELWSKSASDVFRPNILSTSEYLATQRQHLAFQHAPDCNNILCQFILKFRKGKKTQKRIRIYLLTKVALHQISMRFIKRKSISEPWFNSFKNALLWMTLGILWASRATIIRHVILDSFDCAPCMLHCNGNFEDLNMPFSCECKVFLFHSALLEGVTYFQKEA
jgi:hypothetical protein